MQLSEIMSIYKYILTAFVSSARLDGTQQK